MTDKEKILAEIERLINELGEQRDINLEDLRDFINSLPEETISKDLELAATKYAQDKYMPVQTSQAFKAGSQWQKEKAVKWIEQCCDSDLLGRSFLKDFKQAMED